MQAYNQAINDLDKELDHLKQAFEVIFAPRICNDNRIISWIDQQLIHELMQNERTLDAWMRFSRHSF
jgi:hypothetical protein